MKNSLVVLLMAGCWLLTGSVYADVPHLIRYQGTAVDSQGVPLEGPYTLTFQLYDAETDGAMLWEETQSDVPMTQGHFSVLLGTVTPLTTVDWSQPCWLSVLVNNEELLPRQPITSVPMAITAERLAAPLDTTQLTDSVHELVPTGAIIMWDGSSCPEGYTRLAAYDERFLVASSTAGTAGGSNSHAHDVGSYQAPAHTHTIPATSPIWGQREGNFGALGVASANLTYSASNDNPTGSGGGGAISGTSAATDNRPAFATILLCKKD